MKITPSFYQNEKGQSILEVVFVLPFLFIFVGLLIKLNMSVQTSIVNTQYARSQIYVLAANSPEYPRQSLIRAQSLFKAQQQDLMILGVADPEALDQGSNEGKIDPIPQTQKIGRNKTVIGSDERGEQVKRSEIRIRNTSALCTQLNSLPSETSIRWPFGQDVCRYKGMDGG